MLLTDGGYKEFKLGRIFPASALQASPVAERGGELEASVFVSHLGTAADFGAKFERQLAAHTARGEALVFISDGAIWLRQLMEKACPKATLILDVYHALEHIGQAGQAALGTGKAGNTWFEVQRTLLLESRLDEVLRNISALALPVAVRDSACGYLRANCDRMDYKQYRQRGLLIGSGAIESAHRTVM